MDDAVLKLVDDVLANVPAALREACSCRGILAGLETAGAFDVRTLWTLLEQDYAEVKQSISGAALPAIVAKLKEALLLLPASAVPATPGPLFQVDVLFRSRAAVFELMPPIAVLAGASAMGSSPLFAALDLLFRRYNITTVDELAILLRQDGNGAADYITGSDNRQAA